MNKKDNKRPPVTGERGANRNGGRKTSSSRSSYDKPSRNRDEGRSYGSRSDRSRVILSDSEGSPRKRTEGIAPKREGFAARKNACSSSRSYGSRNDRSRVILSDSEGSPRTRREGFAPKREGAPRRSEKNAYTPDEKKYTYKERVHKVRRIQEEPKDTSTVRLNKFISNSGVCSRREADTFITTGLVTVNGQVVTELGVKIDPLKDEVRFNGERLKGEHKVYIVMNKPKNFVTTLSDPHAEKTVMELITKDKCKERVLPIGRLDKATTGVLLFSNDGMMIEKLTHPSYQVKKIYHVSLDKNLKHSDFEAILNGLDLEDGEIHADALSYVEEDNSQVGIEIHSGRNRIVRRIFEHLGYRVKKLDRVYFAGITKKNLKRGQWRFLEESEVNMLKMGAWQ